MRKEVAGSIELLAKEHGMPTYRMFRQFVEEQVLAVRDQRIELYAKTCNDLRHEWHSATPKRQQEIREEYARASKALRDWSTMSPGRLTGFADLLERNLPRAWRS